MIRIVTTYLSLLSNVLQVVITHDVLDACCACSALQMDTQHAGVLCPGAMSPAPFDPPAIANRNSANVGSSSSVTGHTTAVDNALTPCIPPALLVSLSPRIIMVDNFLEPSLCDALMNLASPRLVRSRVSTGKSAISFSTVYARLEIAVMVWLCKIWTFGDVLTVRLSSRAISKLHSHTWFLHVAGRQEPQQ